MECPICYTNTPDCKYFCGHSFCKTCTKEWFTKCDDEPSCPMCRKSIYFKGIDKKKDEWEEERIDNMFQRVFAEAVDDILEDDELSTRWILFEIGLIEDRLRKLKDLGEWLTDVADEDYISYVVSDVFTPIVVCKLPPLYYTVPSWIKMLAVSKHKNTTRKTTNFNRNRSKRITNFNEIVVLEIVL